MFSLQGSFSPHSFTGYISLTLLNTKHIRVGGQKRGLNNYKCPALRTALTDPAVSAVHKQHPRCTSLQKIEYNPCSGIFTTSWTSIGMSSFQLHRSHSAGKSINSQGPISGHKSSLQAAAPGHLPPPPSPPLPHHPTSQPTTLHLGDLCSVVGAHFKEI